MAQWFRGALIALALAVALPPAGRAADPVAGDLVWLEALAAKGDADAWYRIGIIREQGIGVPVDVAGATAAYEAAAGAGHLGAQLRLAQLLAATGDDADARHWYGMAAAQGDAVAAYNVGLFEETGRGGAVDLPGAVAHYHAAVAAGVGQGAVQLALLHFDGRLGVADRVAALAWIAKATALNVEGAATIAATIDASATAEERAAAVELAKTL